MAVKADIFLDRNSDFTTTIKVVDTSGDSVDISGYTVNAVIKSTYSNAQINTSSSSTLAFTAVAASNGDLTLSLTDTQTAFLIGDKRYVYDVKVSDGSSTNTKLVEGVLHCRNNVSWQ